MLYIMRRTQLYLEDDLWAALHAKALLEKATVSELVRVAVRERYMGNLEERRADMMAAVGIWKDRDDLPDTETYLRNLRKDTRLKRLGLV
jgi:Arc/MetJ family transcription regulator